MAANNSTEKQKVFISYLDDDDTLRNAFLILIELKDEYARLETSRGSQMIVPIHRIRKIKLEEKNG